MSWLHIGDTIAHRIQSCADDEARISRQHTYGLGPNEVVASSCCSADQLGRNDSGTTGGSTGLAARLRRTTGGSTDGLAHYTPTRSSAVGATAATSATAATAAAAATYIVIVVVGKNNNSDNNQLLISTKYDSI